MQAGGERASVAVVSRRGDRVLEEAFAAAAPCRRNARASTSSAAAAFIDVDVCVAIVDRDVNSRVFSKRCGSESAWTLFPTS